MGPSDCVFARNCIIRRLEPSRAADFLAHNHFLGACRARYYYGLFVERTTGEDELACPKGTLVAVGSFSNGRRFRDGHLSYEWIRYSSLKDMRVMGGMGKILKYFIERVHPEDVMTYVDASRSDGAAYKALGFVEEGSVERDGFTNLKLKLYLPPQDERNRSHSPETGQNESI